jgi:hypothetical protein
MPKLINGDFAGGKEKVLANIRIDMGPLARN